MKKDPSWRRRVDQAMRTGLLAVAVAFSGLRPAAAEPKWIKVGEVAQTTLAAMAAARPKEAALGAGVQVAWSEGTRDLEASRKALAAAWSAASLRIIDSGDAGRPTGEIVVTLEDARGVRARVSLGPERGGIVVIARPTHSLAPGECTALPQRTWNATVHARGVNNHGQHHSSDITWQLNTARLYDVDGDGVLDTFVPLHGRGQCPEQGLWQVYVMRGSCGHLVGTVGPGWLGSELATVSADASGFRPLTFGSEHATYGEHGTPELVHTITSYRYNGKEYRKEKSTASSGECHHCSVWFCTTP